MSPPSPPNATPTWLAGAATVPFPVPNGTPLAGYVARSGPSLGTLDPLIVGALAIELNGERLTLITADLVAVDGDLTARVREALGQDAGAVLLCASHTHSGPAGIVPRLHPSQPAIADPDLQDRFILACLEAADRAAARHPVTIRLGRAAAPGVATERNDPARPTDPTVTTISLHAPDGSLAALLVHFAAHPTILPATNRHISADLPGGLRRALPNLLGTPHALPILFVNGAAADVSTRFTRRAQDQAEVERLGQILAQAALSAIATSDPITPRLLGGSTTLTIDPRPPWQDEQSAPPAPAQPPLRCRAIGPPSPTHREKGLGGEGRTLPTSADRIAATRQEGRRLLAALAAAPPSPAAVELSAVVLGNLALVTIPGELPAALGADLAARSPAPTTLVLGYANGHAGYLVAASAVDSYEALASPFGPDAGPAVVTAALAHLHGLWSDAPGAPR